MYGCMDEPGRAEWACGTDSKAQTKFNLDQVQNCWLGCWPAALEMGGGVVLTDRPGDKWEDVRLRRPAVRAGECLNAQCQSASAVVEYSRSGG